MRKILIVIRKLFSKLGRKLIKSWRVLLNFSRLSKKHKILLFSLTAIILLIIYLSISLLVISPSRLELAKLKKNFEKSGPCHETCLRSRQISEEKISNSLKDDKKLQVDIKKYFLDNTTNNLAFRKELLNIISLAYGSDNPPNFIIDYLADKNSETLLRAEIIHLFLAKTSEPSLIEYYFAILNSEEKDEIKQEAVRALSNLQNKSAVFKVAEVSILNNLILNDKSSLGLKADFLFLLNDYFSIFPEETKLALTSIYASSQEPILKALSAETLNNFGYKEFIIPEIPEAEWAKYFDN
jgi:hypothetical protein